MTPEQRAELWFKKIERDVIARGGVFTSVTDLRRKLMRAEEGACNARFAESGSELDLELNFWASRTAGVEGDGLMPALAAAVQMAAERSRAAMPSGEKVA